MSNRAIAMPEPYYRRGRSARFAVRAIQWQPHDPQAAGAAAGWLMGHSYKPELRTDFVTGALLFGWRDDYGLHEVAAGEWIVRDAGHFYGWSAANFTAEFTAAVDA